MNESATGECALFTPSQHQAADRRSIANGASFDELVERAGRGVADVTARLMLTADRREVLALVGPGNNGADAMAAARHLSELGFVASPVRLVIGDHPTGPEPDQAHRVLSPGDVTTLLDGIDAPRASDLIIVDGVFGAGLTRALTDDIIEVIEAIRSLRERGARVVAIDVPTGLDGATGQPRPIAMSADATVTFTAKKPGHLLLPGRDLCGDVVVADIGIPCDMFDEPSVWENDPRLWQVPTRTSTGHKYSAGHALVVSGDRWHTGASRLAAQAALRIGAGAVTIAGDQDALEVHAHHVTEIMLAPLAATTKGASGRPDQPSEPDGLDVWLAELIEQRRFATAVIGPALGLSAQAELQQRAVWQSDCAVVADADALTIIATAPDAWFGRPNTILTPHAAEFDRVFGAAHADASPATGSLGATLDGVTSADDKLSRTRAAARLSGAVIVHKGADTVIADPDGRAVINSNAPPSLATAGSGDVLAGIIGGLSAQGMEPFDAACAGVWLHGDAARRGPRRLIATDLIAAIADI